MASPKSKVTTKVLDSAIEAQEEKLARLAAEIETKAAIAAALDEKILQARAQVGKATAEYEQKARAAEQHYKETYVRVKGEYEAKTADFNGAIAKLREELAQVREALRLAHKETVE